MRISCLLWGASLGVVSVLVGAGCADQELDATALDTAGMEALPCGTGDEPAWLADLSPAVPATYLELVNLADETVLDRFGEPCAEATDKPACMERLASTGSGKSFEFESCGECLESLVLIVNRGDEVEALGTQEEVLAFLGTIDTALEAAWVTEFRGETRVSCEPGARKVGDAFEVAAEVGCGGRAIVRVEADGSARTVEEVEGEPCPAEQQE